MDFFFIAEEKIIFKQNINVPMRKEKLNKNAIILPAMFSFILFHCVTFIERQEIVIFKF